MRGLLFACSALLLVATVFAQTSLTINQVVPTGVTVKTSAPGVIEVTPSLGTRRRLIEETGHSRALLQSPFGGIIEFPPFSVAVSASFVTGVAAVSGSVQVNGTRRLLAAPIPLTFHGEVKKHLTTGAAVGSYLFDASTNPFFSSLAVSGSDATSSYTFLRALLIFPQEGASGTTPPPFAESSTGFVTSDKPIIVRLSTQGATDYVPSIALRFDYSQTGTAIGGGAVTPFVSIYYTDFVGSYPAGLPATAASSTSAAINLAQTPGVFAMHA